MRSLLWWSAGLLAWAVAVIALVTFPSPAALRAGVVLSFLLTGPGLAFVRLLRFEALAVGVTLSVSVSVLVDVVAAGSLLYAGIWSSEAAVCLVADLCEATVIATVFLAFRASPSMAKRAQP